MELLKGRSIGLRVRLLVIRKEMIAAFQLFIVVVRVLFIVFIILFLFFFFFGSVNRSAQGLSERTNNDAVIDKN